MKGVCWRALSKADSQRLSKKKAGSTLATICNLQQDYRLAAGGGPIALVDLRPKLLDLCGILLKTLALRKELLYLQAPVPMSTIAQK